MDAEAMRAVLARIPFTRHLDFQIERAADGDVRMTLPDSAATRNLAGTVHAGTLYTFGETVAGVAAGLETLDRAFPFARRAEIHYRLPARGVVHGLARVDKRDIERVLEELSREGRAELTVEVALQGPDGRTVAEMEVDYAFRPLEAA